MNDRTRNIILILFLIALLFTFYSFPATEDRMINIQNYLITVGGIISALAIAYLAGKIFSLRTERESRQVEIDKLADKLSNFRKFIYHIMNCPLYWSSFSDISRFKRSYPELNYQRLHSSKKDEDVTKFHLEENGISKNTIDLYCAMSAIYNEEKNGDDVLWPHQKYAKVNYTIEELQSYLDPINQIWYYLINRYEKHGKGILNDIIDEEKIRNLHDIMPRIDIKYNGAEFSRKLIGEIASDFYTEFIPKHIDLTKLNSGLPKNLKATFMNLILIMVFGVILPITIQSIKLKESLNIYLTLTLVALTITCIIKLIIEFYNFMREETDATRNYN